MQPVKPINIYDYEVLAQPLIHQAAWDYYYGGSNDEVTLRENRAAYQRLRLRPRVLVDVSHCELDTTVLGDTVSMPILIAPAAAHGMAHPEAESATAQAAGAAKTLMTVSSSATHSLETIAQVASGPLWFQLYIDTHEQARQYVQRAEEAGYKAIVLTVDTPRLSRRERDFRNNFGAFQTENHPDAFSGHDAIAAISPTKMMARVRSADDKYIGDTLTWNIIAELRSYTSLPLVLKGILTAEDALLAVEHGVAGIIVSNHGGRQLDGAIPTIEALPEVAEAVNGRCEVYLDSGIRRGTDVLKALALGARAVLIGRPVLWGLIVNGQTGVEHVLELLRNELELAMVLAGCPNLRSITRALVR